MEVKLDIKIKNLARLGPAFTKEHLIDVLPKKERQKALKRDRLEKWFKMVTYGLDSDIAHRVVSKEDLHLLTTHSDD